MEVVMRYKQKRAVIREAKALEGMYGNLRKKVTRLRQEELALWRRVEKLASRGTPSHLMTVEHRGGRKESITRYPLTSARSVRALARARGSSGLFCGCRAIVVAPQPDGSVDICVLYRCSNEPEKTGFQCEYWCFTIESPPVVAIARKTRQRGA